MKLSRTKVHAMRVQCGWTMNIIIVECLLMASILLFNFFTVEGKSKMDTDYFSSVAGMEELHKTELVLYTELQAYVDAMQQHVQSLQNELDLIRIDHIEASNDLEGYLSNPVNAYRLIKRLHSDWPTFEETISNDQSRTNFLEVSQLNKQNLSFPNDDDIFGAALGLMRLQETYNLDVAEVASGILNGVKYGSSMSWQDCFMLGHHLYALRAFNHTVPWLKQSMKLLIEQDYHDDAVSLDFIETVAAYHQEMGDFETALQLVNHILSVDSTRNTVDEMKTYLEAMLLNGTRMGLLYDTPILANDYHQTEEFRLYERVCRADVEPTATQQRNLRCRFYSNNDAFHLLQPFKLEVLHLDPYVVTFHDVLKDIEIDIIKEIAKPKISRSKVRSVTGRGTMSANFRISKTAWFSYNTDSHMRKMRTLLQAFSGLNMDSAEDLQVVNYGIGGHYEPHWDFFKDADDEDGNRIATCIFYLSDVEEGGGTAFPYLPLLVKPKKGSVLLWDNLHSSGEPDYRTRHAGCPVLKGSKWIANIWVRYYGQEYNRPCNLTRDEEKSLQYKD